MFFKKGDIVILQNGDKKLIRESRIEYDLVNEQLCATTKFLLAGKEKSWITKKDITDVRPS